MSYHVLEELPPDHPLRNAPLADIGAEYRWKGNVRSRWISVTNSWAIARSTFNDLGTVWTDGWEWIVRA